MLFMTQDVKIKLHELAEESELFRARLIAGIEFPNSFFVILAIPESPFHPSPGHP